MSHIVVSGITPTEAYPRGITTKYSKQCLEYLDLCIPTVKPDIEEINEIEIEACVENIRIIDTMLGQKLVIEGRMRIKVIYTADNMIQSVHSASWEKIFYNFVLLNNIGTCHYSGVIGGAFIGIEDIGGVWISKRRICLSVILAICPKILEYKEIKGCSHEDYFCIDDIYCNKVIFDDMPINTCTKVLEYRNSNGCISTESKCTRDKIRDSRENSKNNCCKGYGRDYTCDFYKK